MMNILIIDNNNKWIKNICENFVEQDYKASCIQEDILNEHVDDVGKRIKETSANVDIFFINVNLLVGRESRDNCSGIKLLKLLRFYGLNQHCVLYSFMSQE